MLIYKYKINKEPLKLFLKAIRLSSKSWYLKEKEENNKKDEEIKKKIENILYEFPCYGYRRITHELKRIGEQINGKKIRRIMKKYGLFKKRRKIKVFTTDSNHKLMQYPNLIKDIIPLFPDHVWAADITYIKLRNGKFCYLAAVIDVFTRNIRGWNLENTLETELVTRALIKALQKGNPIFHHSDRGKQYCAENYAAILKSHNIQISMSDKGEPTQNPYVESFFKTLKVEEVYMFEYETTEDARNSIYRFIEIVYTKKRLHSSLGYAPPEEFEARFTKLKGRLLLNYNNAPKIEKNNVSAVS
jgi:putative transposase